LTQTADVHSAIVAQCIKVRAVYIGVPGAGSVDLKPKQILMSVFAFVAPARFLNQTPIRMHSAFFRNVSAATAADLAALRTIVIRT